MVTEKDIKRWCSALKSDTHDFKEPVVLKNQLGPSLIAHLEQQVMHTIGALEANSNQHLRLYLKKHLEADGFATLTHRKPQVDENVSDWAKRCFPEEFGIIMNSIQNYSDELASFSYDFFEQVIDQFRFPLGGTDISFFIGDYQYTPLGFHKDPTGHKVIHLHLGPGTKEMYLIPAEVYEKDIQHITRDEKGQFGSFMDYERLIPYATKYEIEPGDIFYMPPSIWHVGVNKGLSAAVTLWHLDITPRDLQRKILLALKEKLPATLNKTDVLVSPDDVKNGEVFEQLSARLGINHIQSDESFAESVAHSLKDYASKLSSNGGYIQQGNIKKAPEQNWATEDQIKLKHPFKLVVDQNGTGKMTLFLRGHRISCPANKNMPVIATQLNDRQIFDIGHICGLLEADWSPTASRQFITLLDGYDVLERIALTSTVS